MHNLENATIECPYCGEPIEVVVDCSVDCQEYIEDCSVCCRPILFSVVTSDGNIESIETRTEDE
jgi:hypothetical protein